MWQNNLFIFRNLAILLLRKDNTVIECFLLFLLFES
jgi:hypothetical protein